MSVDVAESHAHQGGHAHHWETSVAPLVISIGIVFVVPLTFASYYVYDNPKLAILFGALGVLVLILGVGKWIGEALSHKNIIEGAAAIAFPMFIVSEIFMFMALFVAYWVMRLFSESWPPVGTPEMESTTPLVMLSLMILSSVTLFLAGQKHAEGDLPGFRSGLLVTMGLGVVFLGATGYEYHHLIGVGFTSASSVFGTAYYSITGFHAVHVFLGICTFLFMYVPALSGKTNKTFVLCASIFWYFLTVASLFVVSQVYFW
jgi:cytochrome c oxidase subunit III